MSITRIRIESFYLDKRSDILVGVYYDKLLGHHKTLLKNGTVLNRLPLPKEKSDEWLEVWEHNVMTHETSDVQMPTSVRGEMYSRKRLVFYFQYENDNETVKLMPQTEQDVNKRWKAFHDFHQSNPDMYVSDAAGNNSNKRKIGDARWKMTDMSEKSSKDVERRRLAQKMNGVLGDAFDTDRKLFLQLCHGINLSKETTTYAADHNSLLNIAMSRVDENPYLLKSIIENPDKQMLLDIRQAIGNDSIKQSAGKFWIAEEPIADTEEELIRYFKVNEAKYALISEKKVSEPTSKDASSVPDEATINQKCKHESQRVGWVKARRNQFKDSPEDLALFNERLAKVWEENNWNTEAVTS